MRRARTHLDDGKAQFTDYEIELKVIYYYAQFYIALSFVKAKHCLKLAIIKARIW